jgi:hypothetical protein
MPRALLYRQQKGSEVPWQGIGQVLDLRLPAFWESRKNALKWHSLPCRVSPIPDALFQEGFRSLKLWDELKRARARASAETISLEEMVIKRMAELRAKPIMD